MEIEEYRDHLCEANLQLLAEIEQTMPVKFEKSEEKNWASSIRKTENCGVVYCMDYFSDNKIAHELLHIKVDIIMGDNGIMLQKCGNNGILRWLFLFKKNDAASKILNAYEHQVIYPQYISMGFNKNEFFEDQNAHSYDSFIEKISTCGIRTKGRISFVDFITAFSSIMSYLFFPVDDRFNTQLAVIKKKERELFGIFKSFKDQLLKIPINKKGREHIQMVYAVFMSSLDKFIMKNCDTQEMVFKIYSSLEGDIFL